MENKDRKKEKGVSAWHQLWTVLYNHLLILVGTAVLCAVVGGFIATFALVPRYEASAILLVNLPAEQVTTVDTARSLTGTYRVVLTSDAVLEPAMQAAGLTQGYDAFSKNVSVEAVDDTRAIRVAVQDADPRVAKNVVTQIVQLAPAAIQDALNADSVKVISSARVGSAPVWPNKLVCILLAGAVGLLVSALLVLLRSLCGHTVKSPEDVQRKLGIVVLGVIPEAEELNQ